MSINACRIELVFVCFLKQLSCIDMAFVLSIHDLT